MPKKLKVKAQIPSVPEIYRNLNTRPETTKQCLVEDVHRQWFLFNTPQECHIVDQAIHRRWPTFDSFANEPKQVLLAYHGELFGSEPPKDQDLVVTALMCWYHIIAKATDRTAKTPRDPKTGRKSTIQDRKYFLGEVKLKPAEYAGTIKTPQAISCFRIFTETLGDKPALSEADLEKAIRNRAGELRTRQDPWRIFQYYRPQLISKKLIKHD